MSIASALRSVLCVLGIALTATISPLARAQTSTAADGFDPNVDGTVFAMAVQADGKILLGGRFKHLSPNGGTLIARQNIARVLPDGRNDDAFAPAVGNDSEQVNAIVVQSDGKILLGGTFTTVNGVARYRVVRLLTNGTVDPDFEGSIQPEAPSLETSLTPEVRALALQSDGKILVGGGFAHRIGTTNTFLRRILRLDTNGEIDPSFQAPNPDNMVLAIAVQPGGGILIGGGFQHIPAGSTAGRSCIARLKSDGAIDDSFTGSANNTVSVIELLPEGGFLIGGDFTVVNNVPALRIAKLTDNGGAPAETFLGEFTGRIRALKAQADGRIVAGGAFRAASGGVSRNYIARLLPNGLTDSTFIPLPNQEVHSIVLQPDGSIVFGGAFLTVTSANGIDVLRNHVARVSPLGITDATFRPDASGRMRTLAVLNRTSNKGVLIGGTFTGIAGETHSGVARLDANGALVRSFKASVNGPVLAAVEQENGQIIIAGSFDRVNGIAKSFVARLNANGELDPTFDPAPNAQVNAVAIDGNNIYLGGNFTALSPLGIPTPVQQSYFARVGANGALDTAFIPQFNNAVLTLLVEPDHKVLVGGQFTVVRGANTTLTENRYGAVRINTDGTIESTFHPNVNGVVHAMARQSDGAVVIGGSFQQVITDFATVTERWNVMRVKPDGTLDPAFDPRPNDIVKAVAVLSGDAVLIGGRFNTLRPKGEALLPRAYNYVARIKSDGSVDEGYTLSFDDLPGNEVVAIVPSGDTALIAGAFTNVSAAGANHSRSRLVQVSTSGTGSLVTSFNPEVGTATGVPIEALTLLSNGGVLAAGGFSGFNGTVSTSLAWFDGDGSPEMNFVPAVNGPVHAVAQFPMKGSPIATQRRGFAWLQPNGQLRPTYVPAREPTSFGTPTALAVEVGTGNVLMAGSFTIGGAAEQLARFKPDGSIDLAFVPKMSGTISAIRVQSDGKILIGGTFTQVGTVTRNNIARLNANGTLDETFNPNANGGVYTIDLQADGKIVIGGAFTTLAPNGATSNTVRFGVARLATTGEVDTAFDPAPNGNVNTVLVMPDGKILIGGSFTAFRPNGATTDTAKNYLARLDANGAIESVDVGLNGNVTKLVRQPADNKVIVLGNFQSVGTTARSYVARLNSDLTLDTAFDPNPNGPVMAAGVDSQGRIVIGGTFTALQPNSTGYDASLATPRFRAARLVGTNGAVDPSFNPTFDSTVTLLAVAADNSIIAAGTFNTIQPSGTLLVGGSFTAVNNVAVKNLALFSNDGSVSSAFLPEPNGPVWALLPMADGRSVIAGEFTNIAEESRNRIARFKADDTLDTAFNPNANGTVYAVVRQPDGKLIVGGAFTNIGGAGRNHLARLNEDGTADSSFSAAATGVVHAIALQADGKVLYTADVAGGATNSLVRVNADGTADTTFNAGNNGRVNSIAVQTDGKIVVGGSFTVIGGGSRTNLARLDAQGRLDTTITALPDGEVTVVTIQPDGKILFGGLFTTVADAAGTAEHPRFGLARLGSTVMPTSEIVADSGRASATWVRSGASPEVSGVVAEISSDQFTWSAVGQATRIAGTSNWRISGLPVANRATYLRLTASVPVSPNSSAGLAVAFGRIPAVVASDPPVITTSGTWNLTSGVPFSANISATGNPTFTATGLPAGMTLSPAGKLEGTTTATGAFNVIITATNDAGSTSVSMVLIVSAAGTSQGRLYNLSVRAGVRIGQPIIAGVVVSGPLVLLVRGIGPGLAAAGVDAGTVLPTPNLKIFNGQGTLLFEGNSWGGDPEVRTANARLGAFALSDSSADAATLKELPATGGYSMHLSAVSGEGGVGLLEFYDASVDPLATPSRLVNISARGTVATTDNVAAGFVIIGDTPKRLLIRAVGPSQPTEVTGKLSDPELKVYSRGALIARNDNWETPVTVSNLYPAVGGAEITAAGNAKGAQPVLPSGSSDAAVVVTLGGGIYTVEVNGVGTSTGAVTVEVYEIQ